MFRTTIITAIFAATISQAAADPAKSYDLSILPADVAARVAYLQQYGDRFEAVIEATLAEWSKPSFGAEDTSLDFSILPPDVATRVAALQQHGDRFEPVIRAIFYQAMTPSWSDCGHDVDTVVEMMPQS